MSGKGGAPAPPQDRQVWLLGRSHPSADRSIGWGADPFPDLADPDVLVIDLTTLTEKALSKIDNANLRQVGKSIDDKLLGGGTIVVITHQEFSAPPYSRLSGRLHAPFNGHPAGSHACSSYRMLPVILKTVQTQSQSKSIKYGSHDFGTYLDGIKSFTFYIEKWQPLSPLERNSPCWFEKAVGQDIEDNSGRDLGFTLTARVADSKSHSRPRDAGRLVFLPPPTEDTNIAIEKILSACGKASPGYEAPPAWVDTLSFAKADMLQEDISKLETSISKIREEISGLKHRKRTILAHRRLLHAKGAELEVSVVNAFKALGFSDAERAGGPDSPDCIIEIDTDEYQYGLVEVKGANGRTREQDIAQCIKWVDKMHEEGEKWPKPIFVPNQYRWMDYPQSRKNRLKFEQHEIDYARERGVCIIPACVLYDAVKKATDEAAPDKAKVAERIAGTDGVLESVF